jgi:hypothetical protein
MLHLKVRNLPIRNLRMWLALVALDGYSSLGTVPDCSLPYIRALGFRKSCLRVAHQLLQRTRRTAVALPTASSSDRPRTNVATAHFLTDSADSRRQV